MNNVLISIITNGAFISVATFVIKHFLERNLNKQDGYIQKELEEIKSDIQIKSITQQELLNKKRQVYIELVASMAVFIEGRVSREQEREYKERFLKAYDVAWLWASDSVLKDLSRFVQITIEGDTKIKQKEAFSKCVIAMRKDLGFTNTEINLQDYKFVLFGPPGTPEDNI